MGSRLHPWHVHLDLGGPRNGGTVGEMGESDQRFSTIALSFTASPAAPVSHYLPAMHQRAFQSVRTVAGYAAAPRGRQN